jgi:PAS domain S-box-containing protein
MSLRGVPQKQVTNPIFHFLHRRSLRQVLIVLLIVQTVSTVALAEYFGFKQRQQNAKALVNRLQDQISTHVVDTIDLYLEEVDRAKTIGKVLKTLEISSNGQVFIIEQTGCLVAASTSQPEQTHTTHPDQVPQCSSVGQPELIRLALQQLHDRLGNLNQIQTPQRLEFSANGKLRFLKVVPFQNQRGLDWLIVVVMPEFDFVMQSDTGPHTTLLVLLLACAIATGAGIWVARWLTALLLHLNAAAKDLAQGNFDRPVTIYRRDEVGELAATFNHMAAQLAEHRETLASQVAERTAELTESNLRLAQEITERKQVETALRQSEARYRAILEDQTELIARFQTDGTIVFVNQAFCRYFGLEQAALIGQHYAPIVHAADREWVSQQVQSLRSDHPVVVVENRVITPLGIRWTQWINRGLFNESGDLVEFQSVGRDITDRKQTEAKLQESEAKLNDVLNTSFAAIACFRIYPEDFHREYLYFSAGQEAVFGLTPAELSADLSQWQARVDPDDWEAVIQPVTAEVCAQGTALIEYRFHHKDGSLRWISDHLTARWEAGSNCWVVTAIGIDITSRKQAEAALCLSERRIQHLAANLPGAIYTLVQSPDGSVKFEYMSAAVAEIHEVFRDQVLENPLLCFEQMHPDDVAGYQQAVDRSSQNLTPFHHEWRIITPSGKLKWLEANSLPELRKNGEIAWHGVALDVTERKRAEHELAQAKEAAEAANKAKSAFIANMSHELRTPLNAILGFSQLMAQAALTQQQRQYLETIDRNGEYLLKLINDVLSIAKIEADRLTLEASTFDLHNLLTDLEGIFRLRACEQGILFICHWDATVPQFVQADDRKLRQILTNLLDNAIKFTPAGSVTLRVQQQPSSEETAWLYFEVADTGMGIAAEELEHIFELFAQSESGRKSQQGAGLGLPICRQFVQLMGVHLTVSSAIGQGTNFGFTLPVKLAKTKQPFAIIRDRQVIELAPNQPTYRILVVDDVEPNRELLVRWLTQTKFDVRATDNGQTALELWEEYAPDLIWMDV